MAACLSPFILYGKIGVFGWLRRPWIPSSVHFRPHVLLLWQYILPDIYLLCCCLAFASQEVIISGVMYPAMTMTLTWYYIKDTIECVYEMRFWRNKTKMNPLLAWIRCTGYKNYRIWPKVFGFKLLGPICPRSDLFLFKCSLWPWPLLKVIQNFMKNIGLQ